MVIERQSVVVVLMMLLKKKKYFEKIHQDYYLFDFDISQLFLLFEFFEQNKPFEN
jgi:hypothetical protein